MAHATRVPASNGASPVDATGAPADRVHLALPNTDGTTTTCVAGTPAEIAAVLDVALTLLDEIRSALDARRIAEG